MTNSTTTPGLGHGDQQVFVPAKFKVCLLTRVCRGGCYTWYTKATSVYVVSCWAQNTVETEIDSSFSKKVVILTTDQLVRQSKGSYGDITV